MKGLGHIFLKQSFDVLANQTFRDFNIVVSDHSKNDAVKDVCSEYKDSLNINYFRNTENFGSSSSNINNAIKKAGGKLIKILFQDDFLYHEKSLEEIVENFDLEKDKWLITASVGSQDGLHFSEPFYPKYNSRIHLGKNTISSPSVLTVKNDHPLLFDENLIWLMDCDYYKRCYNKFGSPKILNNVNVVNRIGKHQVSHSIVNKWIKVKELVYVIRKYNFGNKSL